VFGDGNIFNLQDYHKYSQSLAERKDDVRQKVVGRIGVHLLLFEGEYLCHSRVYTINKEIKIFRKIHTTKVYIHIMNLKIVEITVSIRDKSTQLLKKECLTRHFFNVKKCKVSGA